MGVLVGSLALILGVLFRLERISVPLSLYMRAVKFLLLAEAGFGLLLLIGSLFNLGSAYKHFREIFLLIGWSVLLVVILPLPQYAAARSPFAPQDLLLSRMDEAIGFNVSQIVQWARAHESINLFFAGCYAALIPFLFLAMALPPLWGHFTAAHRLLLSVSIAVIIGALIEWLFPATAPWVVYHYSLYDPQKRLMHEALALRTGLPYIVDPTYSGGLIEFPSFHVALAAVSARALWEFRALQIPGLILVALIAVSTVMGGMHYACDVIGGFLLAWVSHQLARAIAR